MRQAPVIRHRASGIRKLFLSWRLKAAAFRPRGFTLIESFVAIVILMSAIIGPLSIASQGLNAAQLGKDQITAGFLAQGAVEYIRWIRDTSRLSVSDNPINSQWLGGLNGPCTAGECMVDPAANKIATCSGTCPVLYYDSTSGFYNYSYPPHDSVMGNPSVTQSTNAPTKFIRRVSITTPVSGNAGEAQVTVIMEWNNNGIKRSITMKEILLNWQ